MEKLVAGNIDLDKNTFGPALHSSGCTFRLWAKPGARVELVLEGEASHSVVMVPRQDGIYETTVKDAGPGTRYWFKIDGNGPFPDPASRYQPLGVHGPSQVVDPSQFAWPAEPFSVPPPRELVVYELHIGTWTPEGTFLSAIEKLDILRDLGINVIELMPIAEFAGDRNWGYDGVALYAPSHNYGTPDDLRRLVVEAHRRGIAVCLDVVYNHLGPDGAYHSTFHPAFYSGKHKTPWGDGLNFDQEGRDKVRAYFMESAVQWIRDYRIDGLRCDAVDTIQDDSQPHFLTELTEHVHAAGRQLGKQVFLIAEDARNERRIVLPAASGGHGFDAVWSDDFHHHLRHRLAGDRDGYYQDFDGTTFSIAKTIQQGWSFTGQHTTFWGCNRGTSPEGLTFESRLFCLQNHDQIGNRAFGERLSTQIAPEAYFAASALLLLAPEIPLLFMGQEWAAPQPFLYFTHHNHELGRLVTEGRRNEFAKFSSFSDESQRDRIPDPQSKETFQRSKLDWDLRSAPGHAACLHWYRRLLRIRKFLLSHARFHQCHAIDERTLSLEWKSSTGSLLAVIAIEGPAAILRPELADMKKIVTSSDFLKNADGQVTDGIQLRDGELKFARAGAALFARGDLRIGDTVQKMNARRRISATYRLQFTGDFGFADAEALIPYLEALGISHIYASPIFTARPGSLSGYDTCDFSRINPELGGEPAFDSLVATLHRHRMGIIVDFVPNHMSAHPQWNLWWRNVLANGPSSPLSDYFDIDWYPVNSNLHGKVLLAILGGQYGEVLESGGLKVEYVDGEFCLLYYDLNLPLNPRQMKFLLGHRWAESAENANIEPEVRQEFESILFLLEHIPAYRQVDAEARVDRERETKIATKRLHDVIAHSPALRTHLDKVIQEFNGRPGEPESFDLLHTLLEQQPYRLSYWRTAMHEINYRRFFDINDLIGLRMEHGPLFTAAHTKLIELTSSGMIDGIRLDHIDGLLDPQQYLEELRAATGATGSSLYLIVEKILARQEWINQEWPVDGTTGYEYLALLNGLWVKEENLPQIDRIYRAFCGKTEREKDELYEAKRLITATSMASELHVLAHDMNRLSERNRTSRDFTLDGLQEALREVVACFPVYRTYISSRGFAPSDEIAIHQAIVQAKRRNPTLESSIFEFIRSNLCPVQQPDEGDDAFAQRLSFAMKFQQYTSPVQAKGMEDTVFYRYSPLASLNEVGTAVGRRATTPQEFHTANMERMAHWPEAMLTTSTHDTKHGEDARIRMHVLSELPEDWKAHLLRWAEINADAKTAVNGVPAPDASDEYLYYQNLLGMWSPEQTAVDEETIERMKAFMNKALKEAKVHTSWVNPSNEYDAAAENFVEQTLRGGTAPAFLQSFVPFVRRISMLAAWESVSQVAIKLASPGVVDTYQGGELWDLNLVDPDNRRPVDYSVRRQRLQTILDQFSPEASVQQKEDSIADLRRKWWTGNLKLLYVATGLRFRAREQQLLMQGSYRALEVTGPAADHLIAFARELNGKLLITVGLRWFASLLSDPATLDGLPERLQDTFVELTADPSQPVGAETQQKTDLIDVLAGTTIHGQGAKGALRWRASELLGEKPAAWLFRSTVEHQNA